MRTSTIPTSKSLWREFAYAILILTFISIDPSDALAVTSKNKAIKNVAVKNAKRSNPTSVVNTLLNGVGAPSSSIGVNGDFYIDTVSMNIYGPKKKNAWPLPKSLVGPQGVAGAPGKQGSNGKDGRDGINGKDGERGPAGSSSTSSGAAGPAGPVGPAGPAGATGPAGPAGPAGAQGVAGPQGAQGLAGAAGTAGAAGAQGEAGPRGLQGLQGETGATGPTGSAGAAGAQGEAGPRGIQGIQGAQGDTGPRGEQGIQGSVGATGPTGPSRVIHGDTAAITLNTSTAGGGIPSSPIVQVQANKKYFFILRQFGAISPMQNKKYFGMEVSVSNVTNLKYTSISSESFNYYQASGLVHQYVFEAVGTFSTGANTAEISFSIYDEAGTTGSNPMTLTGSYYLIESNDLTRIDQTTPVSAIS